MKAVGGWRRRLVIVTLAVGTILVVSELGLRLAGSWYLSSFYRDLFAASQRENTINIVCLGESTTAGLWVRAEDSYPKQLERRLREFYGSEAINVLVPPHVGQNTSQMANRIEDYLVGYRPRLLIMMAGANNEWSLAESNVTLFFERPWWLAMPIKLFVLLDSLRTFKVMRYAYHAITAGAEDQYVAMNKNMVWGQPEYTRFPPEKWVWSFARANRPAFVELWRHDLRYMVQRAKARGVDVLLMTYPINPRYLSPVEWSRLADEEGLPLLHNHLAFAKLAEQGRLDEYLFQDRWHPNERGYRVLAGDVFDFITTHDPLRLRSASPR